MEIGLETPMRYLKGVGEKRGMLYQKLGISSIGDLIRHYPRTYVDFSHPHLIAAAPFDQPCAIRAWVKLKKEEQRIRKGMSLFKVMVHDGSNTMTLTFFNARYAVDQLQVGAEYLFYGKAAGTLTRREMSAPLVIPYQPDVAFLPIYPLTAGLTNRMISANVQQGLQLILDSVGDPLPDDLRAQYQLCHQVFALQNIHNPTSDQALEVAKRRLIFEELLILSIAMAQLRRGHTLEAGPAMSPVALAPFYSSLPFAPTAAQCRAIADCAADLFSGAQMNRLVQGDVGSGKTLVAAACAWIATKAGWQTAMMAPTEILAEQHQRSLSSLLGLLGVRVGLLTGSMTAAQKREARAALAQGDFDLMVGTHALLQETVSFQRLGLVITDEQHRFGVAQRATLSQKGCNPHVLVMSATPIPRTLALIIYGDLDVSVIDELPAGRQPIHTYVVPPALRRRAYAFLRKHLDAGEQAYIICPLVEQGEEPSPDLVSAVDYAKAIETTEFSGYRLEVLHGKLRSGEKERIMRSFAAGDTQLLVATTVVEVGVDVPNATMMLVENAERFGLSQLHQLRGRIGRGSAESHCILVSERDSERLDVIATTIDGFAISEADLKLRGPGDFFGNRQHGLPQLKIADMLTDVKLLRLAQDAADELLANDPDLTQPAHQTLRDQVAQMAAATAI